MRKKRLRPTFEAGALVAEAGADGDALAALGTAAAEDGGAALGLHAGAEAVGLHAAVTVGLKCALGHGIALLILMENLCLIGKFQVYRMMGIESSPWRDLCAKSRRSNPIGQCGFK